MFKPVIFLLLVCLSFGPIFGADASIFVKGLTPKAEAGDIDAQINFMLRYGLGAGVQKNLDLAFRFAKELAPKNFDLYAKISQELNKIAFASKEEKISKIFDLGGEFDVNSKEVPLGANIAFILYLFAANLDDAKAQYAVAYCYEHEYGVKRNLAQAYFWYNKAALQDHASAMYRLGHCYYQGLGVEKNFGETFIWWIKSAKKNYPKACYALAKIFEGNGFEKAAFDYYTKAGEGGDMNAQTALFTIYSEGLLGASKDLKRAFTWLEIAADQGDVTSQFNLGVAYSTGRGTEQNDSKALEWFKKAADQELAAAQCEVARCFFIGIGTAMDVDQAVSWYKKAIGQKNPEAMASLAKIYMAILISVRGSGPFPEQNYAEIKNLFEMALSCYTDTDEDKKALVREELKQLEELQKS